jgi:hypothetical protein
VRARVRIRADVTSQPRKLGGEPMNPRAVCPVCGQTVATHDGRLVRHHGTQMRWSGRRWFRTTCQGSGADLHDHTHPAAKEASL